MTNKQSLVEDNLKLVYYIVSRDYPTYLHDEDIIQCGMLGLVKAANAWREEGLFSTYAGKCIRNEINQEFIRRKPHAKTLSLDATIGEDGSLADILVGDDDIAYIDEDAFYELLTGEEAKVLDMDRLGYDTSEIAKVIGCSVQKVQKILRLIRIKWRRFYGD